MAPKIQLQVLPEVAPTQGATPQFHVDTRGAFGEQVAGVVGEAAQALGKHALESKMRADVAVVEDAETELQRRHQDRLYGTPDKPGALFQQGHTALEGSAAILEQLEKDQKEIEDGLADEGQKRAYRRRTDGSVLQARKQIEAHIGQQRQVVEGQAFEGRRAAALDAIANGYADPALRDRERQNMEPLVMAEAQRRGLEGAGTYPPKDGTPAAIFLGAWRKDVARTVLERMVAAKESPQAAAFLDQPMTAGGATVREVLGADADKYVATIGHLQEQVDAFDRAQQAVDAARDPETGKVNELVARQAIRSAPRVYQREARANLESLLQSEREGWNDQVRTRWDSAKTAYLGGPDGKGRRGIAAIDGATATWLRQNAPDTWKHLLDWSEGDSREAQGLPPSPGQEVAFSTIATRIVDHPEEFIGLDGKDFEDRYLSQVAPRDRRALLGHFLSMKGQVRKPDETLPGNVMAEIVELGRGSGTFPRKGEPRTWSPERAAMHAQIVRDLLEFQATEKAAGRQVKPEQFTAEIKKRLRPVTVVGGGRVFGDRSGVPEIEARVHPDLAGKEYVEEIPDAFRQEAIKELQRDPRASFPTTDANLRYLWEKKKWADGGKQGPPPPRPPTMKPFDRVQTELEGRMRVGTLSP
jgi:hypothetical protein